MAWSIIGSQIDYCNSLFYGMTESVQNRAVRIVCGTGSQHVFYTSSQQLYHLHWLPVNCRIQCKLSTLCVRSRVLNQPQYLWLHSYQPMHLLRSSTEDLQLYLIKLCLAVVVRLLHLENCETSGTFKKHLQTHLFNFARTLSSQSLMLWFYKLNSGAIQFFYIAWHYIKSTIQIKSENRQHITVIKRKHHTSWWRPLNTTANAPWPIKSFL